MGKGEGDSGSPGASAAGTVPKGRETNSPGSVSCSKAGTPPRQQPREEPYRCICCTNIAHLGLNIWDFLQLFILPLVTLRSGCPSLAARFFTAPSGLSLLFCHSRNLAIDQPQLSRVVNGTSQTEGGWKPCGKSLS